MKLRLQAQETRLVLSVSGPADTRRHDCSVTVPLPAPGSQSHRQQKNQWRCQAGHHRGRRQRRQDPVLAQGALWCALPNCTRLQRRHRLATASPTSGFLRQYLANTSAPPRLSRGRCVLVSERPVFAPLAAPAQMTARDEDSSSQGARAGAGTALGRDGSRDGAVQSSVKGRRRERVDTGAGSRSRVSLNSLDVPNTVLTTLKMTSQSILKDKV